MKTDPMKTQVLEAPTKHGHFIRVPVGDLAVHFIPNLFDSETENNLEREARNAEGPIRLAGMLLDSYDYLLCDSISQTEAFRRLKLMRAARKELAG